MLSYTRAAKGEISGFGKIEVVDGPPDFSARITDIKIFEQECTSGETILTTDILTKFYLDTVTAGEDPSAWKLWWHSHNDFNVFFSGRDEHSIKITKREYLLSTCINKKGDIVGRFDSASQIEKEAPIVIEHVIDPKLIEECTAEVNQKVTNKIIPEYIYEPDKTRGHHFDGFPW
jgi:hypothetical protein